MTTMTHVIFASNERLAEFLGANILDDRPFIVMPYLKNGNSRDYLQKHPNSDRLHIVRSPNCRIHNFCDIICVAAWCFSGSCLPPLTWYCTRRSQRGKGFFMCHFTHSGLIKIFLLAQCPNRRQSKSCTLRLWPLPYQSWCCESYNESHQKWPCG